MGNGGLAEIREIAFPAFRWLISRDDLKANKYK